MTNIKERPILFSAPMVRAILEGRKTVTRRVMKAQPVLKGNFWEVYGAGWGKDMTSVPAVPGHSLSSYCPYGKHGDRLWVRETWARVGNGDPGYLTFAATYPGCLPPELENIPPASEIRWKPSIHMFRRDSRILLEITDVRVERLQDISEEQAKAEGVGGQATESFRAAGVERPAGFAFRDLWATTGGDWDSNPWVWVVEFKRVTP